MIRTANLTASLSRNAGGLFESVRRLVQSLQEVQVEVRVLGVEDKFTSADLEAWQPAHAEAFKPAWPEKFGYSPRFLEELMAYDPDLTHTHGIWVYSSVATNVYSRSRKRPYIISAHGMLDPWAIKNSRWKKAIAFHLYEGVHLQGARCLRALCEPEARAIRQLGLKNDIVIIPNGVDLPTGPPPSAAPWASVIEPGKKVILFLGRIHPKKGLPNLLRAWAQLQGSVVNGQSSVVGGRGDWALAIAGWDQGGHEQELKGLANELGIKWIDIRDPKATRNPSLPASAASGQLSSSPVVRPGPPTVLFLGPQFNKGKEACYHYCDAFVLPSFSEGVPMAVLEAWAHSKPVVMTPECNIPQGFTAGAALNVETGAESIAEGLKKLVEMSETERAAMGARARALAAERFVWPRIAADMKKVYEWMLGGGVKPDCVADF
jgi:poly(glycerol-phosphate) alpha-glucosyltransferase